MTEPIYLSPPGLRGRIAVVTVNTINPGATDTGYADEALRQAVIAAEPLGPA